MQGRAIIQGAPFSDVDVEIGTREAWIRFLGGEIHLVGVELETVGDSIRMSGIPEVLGHCRIEFFPAGTYHALEEREQRLKRLIESVVGKSSRTVLVLSGMGFSKHDIARMRDKSVKTVEGQQRELRLKIQEFRDIVSK